MLDFGVSKAEAPGNLRTGGTTGELPGSVLTLFTPPPAPGDCTGEKAWLGKQGAQGSRGDGGCRRDPRAHLPAPTRGLNPRSGWVGGGGDSQSRDE